MPAAPRGSVVKMVAGAAPGSKKVRAAEAKTLRDPDKAVMVTFRLRDGSPACVGLRYELTVPGESSPRKGAVTASGRIACGGLEPGKCQVDFVGLDEDG